MAPAACLHCLQNPRLAGWGWISGKYREEESTKLSHPFPLPSRQIGEFEALMLWAFFVRSCAHYDCGGGSREVNETKYKWKQTETNWPNSAVAAKAKYENKCKIQKILIQMQNTKFANTKWQQSQKSQKLNKLFRSNNFRIQIQIPKTKTSKYKYKVKTKGRQIDQTLPPQ